MKRSILFTCIAALCCVSAFAQKNKEIKAGIDNLYSACTTLQASVDKLSSETASAKAELSESAKQITALSEQVRTLESAVAALTDAIRNMSDSGSGSIEYDIPESCTFQNGLVVVRNKIGLYGALDKDGKIVIPFEYSDLESFDGTHQANARKDDKWGRINSNNEQVIPIEYTEIEDKSDGRFLVLKDKKKGVLTSDGEVIVPCKYDDITICDNKYFVVKKGDYYALANPSGTMVTEFKYSDDHDVSFEGKFNSWVWDTKRNGEYYYVFMNGREVQQY